MDLIIDQYEESDTKWNNVITGNSSYRIEDKDYDEIGRQELIDEAKQLEEQGLIMIEWVRGLRGYDIERVTFPLANILLLKPDGFWNRKAICEYFYCLE